MVRSTLFTAFSGTPTPVKGAQFASILQNLTGDPRPMFAQGLAFGDSFPSACGTSGSDGAVTDILNKTNLDITRYVYTIDGDAVTSIAINSVAQKLTPDARRQMPTA